MIGPQQRSDKCSKEAKRNVVFYIVSGIKKKQMYCDTKKCDVTYWLLLESLQWLIQFIWKRNKSKTNKEAKPKKVKLNGIKHQIKAFRRSPLLSLWTMIRRIWLGENTWIIPFINTWYVWRMREYKVSQKNMLTTAGDKVTCFWIPHNRN